MKVKKIIYFWYENSRTKCECTGYIFGSPMIAFDGLTYRKVSMVIDTSLYNL